MTQQEIFDKVAAGLLRQNKKAMQGSCCILIAEDGSRCAYGWLLPEDLTTDLQDTKGTYFDIQLYFRGIGVEYNAYNKKIEGDLYRIHNLNEPENWPRLLQDVAVKHGLNSDIVNVVLKERNN